MLLKSVHIFEHMNSQLEIVKRMSMKKKVQEYLAKNVL